MPVLARLIEAAGIPTVLVTMMPDLAAKFRVARLLGVEFPFGHAFGMVNDPKMQLAVSRAAIDLLASTVEPETRVDMDIEWPVDTRTAYKAWQPSEPSPIVAFNKQRREEIEAKRAAHS